MAIKRREKPLTPQQVIERAKLNLAPFWVGSEPLIAASKSASGMKAYPLDARINDRPWIFLFVDPESYAFGESIGCAREWRSRYEQQHLAVLVIVEARHGFARDRDWLSRLIRIEPDVFVVASDADGGLASAFSVRERPRAFLYSRGTIAFDRSGKDWSVGTESEIQKFFRAVDPGLPLLPAEDSGPAAIADLTALEAASGREGLESAGVELHGEWKAEPDRLVTADPSARLVFLSSGSRVGVVAETLQRDNGAEGSIVVEASRPIGSSREATIADSDLSFEVHAQGSVSIDPTELSRAECALGEPRLYRLLKDLPQADRRVTLRFPSANRHPVAIYSLRFAN